MNSSHIAEPQTLPSRHSLLQLQLQAYLSRQTPTSRPTHRKLSDPINSHIFVHHLDHTSSLPPINERPCHMRTLTDHKQQRPHKKNLSEIRSRKFETIPADNEIAEKFNTVREKRMVTERAQSKGKRKFIEIDVLNLQTCYAKVQPGSGREKPTAGEVVFKEIISIPSREGISEFIKNYKVRNQHIDVDAIVRSDHFAVNFQEKQSMYFGEIRDGEMDGKGVLITKNSVFEGEWWRSNKVEGVEITAKGTYKGKFVNNQRSKVGEFHWNNGQYYSGEWSKGKKHGTGIWKSKKGDVYMGQWAKGKVQGYGIHLTKNGQKYQGFFLNFLKQGQGKEYFPNGDFFQGTFIEGKPNGNGTYKWKSGMIYEGEFKQGYRDGNGKIKKNDMQYQGSFQREKAHGEGKLTVWNNYNYVGHFKKGKMQGKGIKKEKKNVYVGIWHDNKFVEKLK